MFVEFINICPKCGERVRGYIDYLDSSTQEGDEYTKNKVECNFKEANKCTRNECPFFQKAHQTIKV